MGIDGGRRPRRLTIPEDGQTTHPAPPPSPTGRPPRGVKGIVVPLMLVASSLIMAVAWLGHLRLKHQLSFMAATLLAWLLVLPEYALNIKALRMGYGLFSGGQMAAIRLASGVVAVALVSRFVLGEALTLRKLLGFGVMILAMVLIVSRRTIDDRASIPPR